MYQAVFECREDGSGKTLDIECDTRRISQRKTLGVPVDPTN
jgi:hypothetical protein